MIRIFICLLPTLLIAGTLFAQANPSMTLVASLPSTLNETSGLICNGPNSLWSHNDSGGEAKLYEVDTLGNITRTLVLRGVTNIDWEDLAKDSLGRFYIGDFGNNSNNRTNLRIYRIPNPDSVSGDTVDPEIIHFSYADQSTFPAPDSAKQFDMEAMIVLEDSIFLFSKNRTAPYDGICKVYALPADTGTHIAYTKGEFSLGSGSQEENWVTAADLSPDGEHILLLSGSKFWLFSCFTGSDFLNGALRRLTHGPLTQKEGVCFRDNGWIYATDELFAGIIGGNLYEANLNNWLWEPVVDLGPDTTVIGDSVVLDAGNAGATFAWSYGPATQTVVIDSPGIYSVTVTAPNGCVASDTLTLNLITSVNETIRPRVRVFPTPSDDGFTIRGVDPQSPAIRIHLRDLRGRLLREVRSHRVPTRELPSGMYLLEITGPSGRQVIKIPVEH